MVKTCVCGCQQRAVQRHHVVYEQHLRSLWRSALERLQRARRCDIPPGPVLGDFERLSALLDDKRNLVLVAYDCHGAHHGASRRLSLAVLPDSVFEFVGEIMSAGKAYEYLRRRYDGADPRLDALIGKRAA